MTSCISYYLNAYYSGPFLNYGIKDQVKDILPSLKVAVVMAIPVGLMQFISFNAFILLPLQIIVGAAIVLTICEKSQMPEYLEIKGIVMPKVKKVIKR